MPLSRAQFEKELVPGLHALIGLEYEQYGQEYSEIFDTTNSKRSFEEETKLVGLGLAKPKEEGNSVFYDEEAGEAWTARYVINTYALGFQLTEEAIEDNLYASLGERYSRQLGRQMAKTKEIYGANVLNFAFNSSYAGGDGVQLCGVHPTQSGLTNNNYAAVGTDLNEATLENALIQVGGWVDERGTIIGAQGKKLIIPIGLQFIAERILQSPYRPGSGDNDVNAMKSMGVLPGGYSVNHYMTDVDSWFIKTNVPDGLKLFQRIKMQKKTEGDFDTGNAKFKARERYAFGWTDPLGMWGSQGAT